ncbi:MAG TPA: hypothetical protein PL045_01705, partial [Chitinophagaceae bacterium]|nr:hypothetical protein [Chitinophagaceae bacterium]
LSYHPFFIKLFHWEYWSFNTVYAPVYIYFIWLGVKARSFFFFNAANPTISSGGFLMESKKEIYHLIPKQYYPVTVFLPLNVSLAEALQHKQAAGLQFPLIAKPDVGGRGRMVSKIYNEQELQEYISACKEDFMLQEFADVKNEVGIFYYRYPDETNGVISGIVEKEFLKVVGDGNSSMLELLQQKKRFILQLPALKKKYGDALNEILPAGEEKILVPFGNHARGSKFLDSSYKVDAALTQTIDAVCKQVPGFYYGRLDIKFSSWEELKQGKNFYIIELNGSGSEPTHIYDPKHSIFFAWKEIIRHWKILYRISVINHKKNKVPYMTVKEGFKMFRDNNAHLKKVMEDE